MAAALRGNEDGYLTQTERGAQAGSRSIRGRQFLRHLLGSTFDITTAHSMISATAMRVHRVLAIKRSWRATSAVTSGQT
jgi:hypothetical protein